ncbi:branched-chain amino acid transport system II carrier protein, partial [Aeromonas finlandensis]|uniref:branched-chain amino acid transport system II carrier protein n=1 Tax=Aeromonas finlandensis TaxID=1543375 RepID=UPI00187243EB
MKGVPTVSDRVWCGFLISSFFLGTSNTIAPQVTGYYSGVNIWLTLSGFFITAIALPLLGLIAIVRCRTSTTDSLLTQIDRSFSTKATKWLSLAIYTLLGPALLLPQSSLVTYQESTKAFTLISNPVIPPLFVCVFFIIATCLSLSKKSRVYILGKYLWSIMIILILLTSLILLMSFDFNAQIVSAQNNDTSFTKGLLNGY